MGWTSCDAWRTRKIAVEAYLAETSADILKHQVVGDTLYGVVRATTGETYILVVLFEKGRGCWAYKDLSELDGPTVVDCPLEFLELAGPPGPGYAGPWRERVRAFHKLFEGRR